MNSIRIAVVLIPAALVGACSLGAPTAKSPVTRGRALFTEHGCYGCHTVLGTGTPIAPDLSRVGTKYDEGELVRLLRDPALRRPGAHMPKLELTEAETRALAAYLASLR